MVKEILENFVEEFQVLSEHEKSKKEAAKKKVPMNFEQASKKTLKEGSTGEEVKYLQELLLKLKFFGGSPQGNFKTLTVAAVKLFQKQNGLVQDGIVGPKTWRMLSYAQTYTPPEVLPSYWKPSKYHPIATVQSPYTHLHPYDFICTYALGEKEIPGSKHNPLLAHTHEHCANLGTHSEVNDYPDETPYCSSGLNWTADGTGCFKTDNALAFSWKKYVGDSVQKDGLVRKGDIIVLGRSHVCIANKDFKWTGSGTFEGLGFNQGNMVKVSSYGQNDIVAVKKWKAKEGTVLRPIQLQAKLGSTVANESTR